MSIAPSALSMLGPRTARQTRAVRDTLLFFRLFNSSAYAQTISSLHTDGRGTFLMFATGTVELDDAVSRSRYSALYGTDCLESEVMSQPFAELRTRVGNNHHFAMLYDPSASMGSTNQVMTVGYLRLNHPAFLDATNNTMAELMEKNNQEFTRWQSNLLARHDARTKLFDFINGESLLDIAIR
jgi:hypothetical protein